MPHDYMFFKLRVPVSGPDDLSDDTTAPIGSAQAIVARLSEILPDLAWSPFGGCVRGTGEDPSGPYAILFSCGKSERTFTVETAEGPTDATPEVVLRICAGLGLVALDGQRDELVGARLTVG